MAGGPYSNVVYSEREAINAVWVLVSTAMISFMQCGFALLESGSVRLLCKLWFREDARGSLLTMDFPFRLRIYFGYHCVRFTSWAHSAKHLYPFLIFAHFLHLSSSRSLELGWWMAPAKRLPRFRWSNYDSSGRWHCWICWSSDSWWETWKGKT